jgi:Autophagocytosis associated protein, active-site domain
VQIIEFEACAISNLKGALLTAHPTQEWLSLHPCNTRAFMGLLLAADGDASSNDRAAALRKYMRAWWSVAGAAVGALRGLLQGNGPMHHT